MTLSSPSSFPAAREIAADLYHRWKSTLLTESGACGHLRVRRPDSPGAATDSTVSEGIAYGMVLAATFDDRETFDALWSYSQAWLDANGLMHWYIDPTGTQVLGQGAATDSDEDIAWALLLAHDRWDLPGGPQPYLELAKEQIERVWRHEIDHDRDCLLMPGDQWTSPGIFNPSYFAPNQYRDFAAATGNFEGWNRVIDTGYRILARSSTRPEGLPVNGLVPAWCLEDGTPLAPFPGAPLHHQYDSARTPYRIGQDWFWHQESRARDYLDRAIPFLASKGVHGIVDGFALDGSEFPDPDSRKPRRSAVFTGCAAVGALRDPVFAPFVAEVASELATGTWTTRSLYYNLSWSALCLAMLSGAMRTPGR